MRKGEKLREARAHTHTHTQAFIDSRQNNEVMKGGEWRREKIKGH